MSSGRAYFTGWREIFACAHFQNGIENTCEGATFIFTYYPNHISLKGILSQTSVYYQKLQCFLGS